MSSECALLVNCPDEILLHIFESLHLPRPTLVSLCHVNTRFRRLAEPLLYHHITWEWQWEQPEQPPLILLLLRSILDRPSLGELVQKISLVGHLVYHWNDEHKKRNRSDMMRMPPKIASLDHEILNMAVAAVRSYGLPQQDEVLWISELQCGTIDAFVALLCSRLPNLEAMLLETKFCKELTCTAIMFRHAIGPSSAAQDSQAELELASRALLPHFPRLREVDCQKKLDPYGRDKPKNTEVFTRLLYLPSIQKLSATIDNPVGPHAWPSAVSPSPSTLTSLDLHSVRERFLAELLSVTTNLQTLRWSWDFCPAAAQPMEPALSCNLMDLDLLTTALLKVRKTLKRLFIMDKIQDGDGIDRPEVEMQGSMNGLAGMAELVTLQIPICVMVGTISCENPKSHDLSKVMPRNLERLYMAMDTRDVTNEWSDYAWEDVVRSYVDGGRWRQHTPRLRWFSLVDAVDDGVYVGWDSETPVYEVIVDIVREAGLEYEFNLHSWEGPSKS